MRPFLDRRPVLALGLLAAMAMALALRAVPGWRVVMPAPGAPVVFRETDPWYHVRAIELQTANFPTRFDFDAYLRGASGGDVPVAPLFDWLAAATALVAGALHPAARTTELVCAWLPAILGALVVLPTARLAWRLGGRSGAAALAAAFVVATLPGQFLARSLLGFSDHHVLEVLTSTTLLAALAGALDEAATARERRRSTAWAALSLAALLLTWVGAASIVLLVALFVASEFALDLAARRASDWLERALLPALLFATLVAALFYDGITMPLRNLFAVAATAGAAALLALAARIGAAPRFAQVSPPAPPISWTPARRRVTAIAAVSSVAVALLAALAVPSLRALLVGELGRLVEPERIAGTVAEAGTLATLGPLPRVLGQEFGGAGPLALAALLLGTAAAVRARDASSRGERLLLVWSLGLALLAWRQNRFLYYLAVPVAVWAALAVSRLDAWIARRFAARSPRGTAARALIASAAMLVAIAFSYEPALQRARFSNGPSADWRATLAWLRASTPEPLGDATAYWRRFAREDPERPRAAWTVGAWWDYGYWILRGAHRVPAADPTQAGAGTMARLLLAPDDERLAALADAAGVRYLVLDQELPILVRSAAGGAAPRPAGKFRSIALWAGEPAERFLERVERRDASGRSVPATIFYPDYYRSALVRQLVFGGQAVEPAASYVGELGPPRPGQLRELVRIESFPGFAAATAALAGRDPERFRIVGLEPATSPVPIPASAAFHRVYGSPTTAFEIRTGASVRRVSQVEVFERTAAP